MFILLTGCSKQCKECWDVELTFDFQYYFAWFEQIMELLETGRTIYFHESKQQIVLLWPYFILLWPNCFIMTIFSPFQFFIFSHSDIFHWLWASSIFQERFKMKKKPAKLQNCFTTLNSRFYPEIFFQSMKSVLTPVFYRPCTMVWPVYWVRYEMNIMFTKSLKLVLKPQLL